MAAKRTKSSRVTRPSRRTQIVWVTFLAAMTAVTAMLAVQGTERRTGFLLTSLETVGGASTGGDGLFQIATPVDSARWTGIVIHHLGEPAGDAESVARLHQQQNIKGLGFHFLIGNGNGLGDGVVHVGYRWNEQLPGAHVIGAKGDYHNQHSIGICLIGKGDRRSYTDRQYAKLINLVQRLQAELHIPARNVYLHRDLSDQTTSPGKFFALARVQEQLLK